MTYTSQTRLRSLAGLLVVLVFGMLLGSFLTYKYHEYKTQNFDPPRDSKGQAKYIVENMDQVLHFSPDQSEKIQELITERIHQIRDLHKQFQPQMEQIRESTQQDLRAVLTLEQQKEFDSLLAEHSRKLNFIGRPPPVIDPGPSAAIPPPASP